MSEPGGGNARDRAVSRRARVGPRHRWRVRMLADVVRQELARSSRDECGVPSQADRSQPGLVLDAGCGDGSLALELARTGSRVIGIDLSHRRLTRAVDRTERAGIAGAATFACADVRSLPLREGDFQVAAAGEVLEHVGEDDYAIAELSRVLAPRGSVAVTVPAGPERLGPVDRRAGHVRRYDRVGLTRLLAGAGLQVVLVEGWGFPIGRLYDRLVQRPALASGRGPTGHLIGALGRSTLAWLVWSALFRLDERVPAKERGSGWLAVARKAARTGAPPEAERPSATPLGTACQDHGRGHQS